MIKVKTFSTPLKILHTIEELQDLDEQVINFIEENNIKEIISVSDTNTTDSRGATNWIIRVVVYRDPK
jgi:hypothetical protein